MTQGNITHLVKQRTVCLVGMILLLWSAWSLATPSQPAHDISTQAEQYFVTTHLQTGMHTKATMDSPVIKLVTGGTPLNIVKQGKEFSEVQLNDGTKGWLYSQFIIPEQPAESRVIELENQLQDLQEKLTAQTNSVSGTEVNTHPDAALQKQLQESRETIAQLKEELKAWEQLDFQDRQAQQNHANQINSALKKRLIDIAALATGEDADKIQIKVDNEILKDEPPVDSIRTLFKKEYLLIIVIGGAGFFLGILVMDMINRRRHGGYRI